MLRTTFSMLAALTIPSVAGAAIYYNPVVSTVGDGTASIGAATGAFVTLRAYSNSVASQVSPADTVTFADGSSGLVATANSSSEVKISNNPTLTAAAIDGVASTGGSIAVTGYAATAGTANVNGAGAASPRSIGYASVGNFDPVSGATVAYTKTNAALYTSTNIRGAQGNDANTDFLTSGTGSGTSNAFRATSSSANVRLNSAAPTNTRSIRVFDGQAFGSTGAGTHGVYSIGSGVPGTGTTPDSITPALFIASNEAYDFVLYDDPNNSVSTTSSFGFDTAYVSVGTGSGSVLRYLWNGTAWGTGVSLAPSGVAGGIFGLAGTYDTATSEFVLFAASPTTLYQLNDNLTTATWTNLATAGTNYAFRSVALTPLPEPASLALIGLAGLVGLRRRR